MVEKILVASTGITSTSIHSLSIVVVMVLLTVAFTLETIQINTGVNRQYDSIGNIATDCLFSKINYLGFSSLYLISISPEMYNHILDYFVTILWPK